MDRARTDLMERAAILAEWPEFRCLTHSVPYLTKRQNELLLGRLARNAMRLSTGCIVWAGNYNNDGYGRMTVWSPSQKKRFSEYVHRLVWFMKTGKALPHWKEIAHKCDVPPCFHPECVFDQRRRDNRVQSAVNTNLKKARRAAHERLAAITRELR